MVHVGGQIYAEILSSNCILLLDKKRCGTFQLTFHQVKLIESIAMAPAKNVKLSKQFSINITPFKGKVYYHIKDKAKNKSVSLTDSDINALLKSASKIKKYGKKMKKFAAKQNKKDKDDSSGSEHDNSSCAEDEEMSE